MIDKNIQYRTANAEVEESTQTVFEHKILSLNKFIKEGDDVSCEVEFEKVAPQNAGEVYRVEVNLRLNGTLFRAEASEESFEKAIDEVRDELDKAIRRHQDKKTSLFRKGARRIKHMLRRE